MPKAIYMIKESILCCKIQYSGKIISGILQWKQCDARCIYWFTSMLLN